MRHDHSQHEQHPPAPSGGHQEHERPPQRNQSNPDPHSNHDGHGQQHNHAEHAGHDKHAGHSPEIFKRRFFICLVLTLPVLYFAPMFQDWFNYQAIQFSGAEWVIPIFSTIIYFYGGWVFLKGAWFELQSKIGMMTLVALADQVRPSAREAVLKLEKMGVQVVMITGDAEAVAKSVAKDLQIDRYYARVLP